MRTAILFGAIIIASAINPTYKMSTQAMQIIGWIISTCMAMDIIEFFHKLLKKK